MTDFKQGLTVAQRMQMIENWLSRAKVALTAGRKENAADHLAALALEAGEASQTLFKESQAEITKEDANGAKKA